MAESDPASVIRLAERHEKDAKRIEDLRQEHAAIKIQALARGRMTRKQRKALVCVCACVRVFCVLCVFMCMSLLCFCVCVWC